MSDPFDTSVWDAPSTSSKPQESHHTPSEPAAAEAGIESFDDFEDFSQPTEAATAVDDFGDDFGDFGEGTTVEDFAPATPDPTPSEPSAPPPRHYDYRPLQLDAETTREELERQVRELIHPLFSHIKKDELFTNEPVREVEASRQILVTPESREMYRNLTTIPPEMTQPVNWTRSHIRRQQLITLGIPVNLDEVLPTSSAKPLPPLHITVDPTSRPQSAPPGRPSTPANHVPRAGTPVVGGRTPKTGPPPLGPPPKLDMEKVNECLGYTESSLSILPLPAVEAHLVHIRSVTESANALLTHLLQARDVHQQDTETYNRLIAELVGEAQKAKAPQTNRWGRTKKTSSMMSS